jgi:hypothetical protein
MIYNVYDIVSLLSNMMTLDPATLSRPERPKASRWQQGYFLMAGDKTEC